MKLLSRIHARRRIRARQRVNVTGSLLLSPPDPTALTVATNVPGARFVLARIEQDQPQVDDVLLEDMPISVYGGG